MYFFRIVFRIVGMNTQTFADKFKEHCLSKGTTPHKVAQEVGENTTWVSEFMSAKRNPTVDRILEFLKNVARSQTLGVEYPTLCAWWSMSLIPPEAFIEAVKSLYPERFEKLKPEIEVKTGEMYEKFYGKDTYYDGYSKTMKPVSPPKNKQKPSE